MLEIKDGELYRIWHLKQLPEQPIRLFVAPATLRAELFAQLHSHRTAGHLGIARTCAKIRQRFFWPGCRADVRRWCSACAPCARVKPGVRGRAELQQHPVGAPIERLWIDIVGPLPVSEEGHVYILVVCDYFTKWTEAYALRDQTAQSVADVLVTEFISRFGVPRTVHSDQGRNFESELFTQMCTLLGADKTRTVAYRPQSDGLVERFNRTLQQMLKILVNEARDDWHELLPYVTMAYRATPQESTGCSPNLMMLGREVTLPVDIMFNVPVREGDDYECSVEYVEWLRRTMTKIFSFARTQLKTAAARQKANYDRKRRAQAFGVGQYVWRFYPPTAKQKLGKGWTGPYRVVDVPTDVHCEIQLAPGEPTLRVHIDQVKAHSGESPSEWAGYTTDESVSSRSADSEDSRTDNTINGDVPASGSEELPDAPNNVRCSKRVRNAPKRLDL